MTTILLADRQDITRAGITLLCQELENVTTRPVHNKEGLMAELLAARKAIVVMDFTLFNINDIEELLIYTQRFPEAYWLMFSEDLSLDFVRRLIAGLHHVGILLKDAPMGEIREALYYALTGQRFICQHVTEMLLVPPKAEEDTARLTKTETEILKDIALGMTTKEIAEKRFSSFHTVNTHRKNIFRKLHVNTAHEATKYALRAGLVDSAEYYI